MFRTFLIAALLVASLVSGTASAQVFIPDLNERAWLNAEIPGIVDANGIMDTLHSGIAGLDTSSIVINDESTTLDLNGLQFLDSLKWFSLAINQSVPCAITCAGLPDGLTSFGAAMGPGSIHLPGLPNSLLYLSINGQFSGSGSPDVQIDHLPDSLANLTLQAVNSIQWSGTGLIGAIYLDLTFANSTHTFTFSPAVVDHVAITSAGFDLLDLSALTTENLDLHTVLMDGPVSWPAQLRNLNFFDCGFYEPMSAFPSTLRSLLTMMTYPMCLPWLPDSLNDLSIYDYSGCIPNWPPALESAYINSEMVYDSTAVYCSVLNTDCPGIYPGISGTAFIDLDANGQHDAGEPPMPQASVVVQPNGNVVGCESDGTWEIGVAPGSYSVTLSSTYPYIASVSPATHTAEVPEMMDADTLNDFAVSLIPDIEDLRAFMWTIPARPGFENRLYLTCQNYGTVPMDAQLNLQFDADQTWVGSSLTPSAQNATSATWELSGMALGASQTITVDLNTAAGVPLGTPITHSMSVLPTAGDETPLDNVVFINDSVVGSYDPNDKSLTPSAMSPAQVLAGSTPIVYTIRFQNTGTYPAERVLILDTLPSGLQVASIQVLGSSHACTWYVSEGVLYVLHEGIALPDSSSDETASHGYVRFSILPATGLVDGEELVNIAHIVFDFNEPIVTPPAVFRVDAIIGMAEARTAEVGVHPNPVRDRLWITLPHNGKKAVAYAVQDLFGRNVLTGLTGNDSAVYVGLLPAGVYVLTVKSEAGAPCVRFVKQ